jgi:hypothetical protein
MCTNVFCWLRGADALVAHIERDSGSRSARAPPMGASASAAMLWIVPYDSRAPGYKIGIRSSIGRRALGDITRNPTTARRNCAGSTLTHAPDPDSSSKCFLNPQRPWPSPHIPSGEQPACPANAFPAHSVFWEVVSGVRCSPVIGCSSVIGRSINNIIAHPYGRGVRPS